MENKITKKKKMVTQKIKSHFTDDIIRSAINAISKGLSVRAASQKYGIPFSTLRCKYKGIYAIGKRSGPSTILSNEEEECLVQWILFMGSKGFPLCKNMLLDSVTLLIKELRRENPFTGGRSGRHWYEGFMKRHEQLTTRTLQNLNKRRADVTEEQLRGWYDEVGTYLKTKMLLDIHPSRIFNCDETAFFLNPKGNTVIVNRKMKSVYNVVGTDDKECLTALITGNAAGQMPPPMVMFAYKRLPSLIVEKAPDGWSVGRSDNGWMTGESFFEYITNVFHPWCINNKIQFPIIMYLDGHSSHATMALSDFCVGHRIELISLFPNSTHITQPMDVALFRPLKDMWKTAVTNYRLNNDGVSIKKGDFAMVLKNAIDLTNTKQCLSNGFTCCGLSPFSADAVNYSKLLNNKQITVEETTNQDQSITNKENAKYKQMLKFIESSTNVDTLELFKLAESRDKAWYGEEKYRELFTHWLKCKKLSENEEVSLVQDTSNNESINFCIIEPRDAADIDTVMIEDINLAFSVGSNNCVDLIDLDENTSRPNKCVDTMNSIPLPFKKALFWPTPSTSGTKIKKSKEKIPAVATSETWREYQKLKIAAKQKKEEEKEERQRFRLENLKIKKEKDEEKAKLKKIREEEAALKRKENDEKKAKSRTIREEKAAQRRKENDEKKAKSKTMREENAAQRRKEKEEKTNFKRIREEEAAVTKKDEETEQQ